MVYMDSCNARKLLLDLNYIKKGENNNLHIVDKDEDLFNHHEFNIYN